jgi:Tol biopolymer transport system component
MTRQAFCAATTLVVAAFACGCSPAPNPSPAPSGGTAAPSATAVRVEAEPGETRLTNIRRLTNGGENAEAYFSRDGHWLTFQSTRDGRTCDQQYIMRTDGSELRRISNGAGKTTCGYFFAGDRKLFFASTHAHGEACPVRPDPSQGYVWGLDKFDIYTVDRDGGNLQRLTRENVYTAEATLSPDGRTIVFTSLKDGDLDIYTMNVDGSNVRRLTTMPGYDGGPFFSPDGKQIVYRAYHPTDSTELRTYRELLRREMVRPNRMEIWVMNADGTGQRQVTQLGGANFAPFFTPDGRRIIFSSNHKNPRSRNFDLYLVNTDGTGLEQVTTNDDFDGFPQFSPDGRQLVWASNRHDARPGETNIFIADWKN